MFSRCFYILFATELFQWVKKVLNAFYWGMTRQNKQSWQAPIRVGYIWLCVKYVLNLGKQSLLVQFVYSLILPSVILKYLYIISTLEYLQVIYDICQSSSDLHPPPIFKWFVSFAYLQVHPDTQESETPSFIDSNALLQSQLSIVKEQRHTTD